MHYLITGGTGFIGLELVASLLGDGHRVTVLTRDPAAALRKLPEGGNAVSDLAALEDVDAVINLAGESLGAARWNAERKQRFFESRVGMTRRLNEWMSGLGVKPSVLVSGSAIGYYGARGDEPLDEDSTPGSDFAAELAIAWEAEARKAEAFGVRVCLLRTGLVLGPKGKAGGGVLEQMLPPFKLGAGGPMGSGRQWMSWVHIADMVALIRWLADTATANGPYDGTAPEPARNADFAKAIGRTLHRPAILPMPAFALRIIVGEMAGMLVTGQKVLPKRSVAEGFRFKFPKLDTALADVLASR